MKTVPKSARVRPEDVLRTLHRSSAGLTLGQVLERHPQLARRTVQRWIAQWLAARVLSAAGEGRGRRYLGAPAVMDEVPRLPVHEWTIPLSADSRDILAYVDQPLAARKPVGYSTELLEAYRPNHTSYLPEPLRRQLRKMGATGQDGSPAGTHGRAVLNRLLIDLSWASSHLEGNTYSRLDTRELIEHGKVAQGKAAAETQMILNHKAAIEMLVENAASAGFNRYTLLNLHSALAENLLPNPADEGRVRQHAVEIGQSVYRPLSVPQQIESMLDLLLDKARQIADPFEQSFFVMVHLPYLQPFADINKRTSRLAANLPLFQANLCPLTFLGVPEAAYSRAMLGVYELARVELLRDLYVWAYERSTQEYLAIKQDLTQPDPVRLAYRGLIKQVVREVVVGEGADPLALIDQAVGAQVAANQRGDVRALIVAELSRLHEGVLARYGLRPAEFMAWSRRHGSPAGAGAALDENVDGGQPKAGRRSDRR